MRLTKRCIELLNLLQAARWLTTGQVHRRFFPQASVNAASKRLRKLADARYVAMAHENRMREALYTLGSEGKRELEKRGTAEITLERNLPKQLEHVLGINDIRIAAETSRPLSYFFACWELPRMGWAYPVIPDAIFCFDNRTFAVEFDRGAEGVRFFVRTKISSYLRGLDGFPLTAILVVTDRKARMESLARAIADGNGRVLYSTVDIVREHGMLAPVFFRYPGSQGVGLV